MELWGIEDAKNMDPVVDLLLDVFAYESARLHNEIEESDSHILSRLSQILTGDKWSLPTPAHALMSINPNRGEMRLLDAEDHFYAEKYIFGKGNTQVFFTPLFSYPLVDAQLRMTVFGNTVREYKDKQTFSSSILQHDKETPFDTRSIWLGIAISDEQLQKLQDLTLCIIPKDLSLLAFLKALRFCDYQGKNLSVHIGLDVKDPFNNAHYFEEIRRYYNDYYFKVEVAKATKAFFSLQQMLPDSNPVNENVDTTVKLWWIKIELPEIFNYDNIGNLQIYLNTYPVVNRQLVYKQHNFSNSGRIIPLPCPKECHFLNIRSIQDNSGTEYVNRLQQYDEHPTGVFSLYFGDLERFDSDDASSLISKTLQRIREDGNAFAAMNPDMLATQLQDLSAKLKEFEKDVESTDTDKDGRKQRVFVLTVPKPEASSAEIKFWVTLGEFECEFNERTFIQQFNIDKYDAGSFQFRTPVQKGVVHTEETDLINNLRYGLVSRDRIVSKEDIHNYILHKIGSNVKSIEFKDGVEMAPEKKKGFVRVMQIEIKLDGNHTYSDLSPLAHFLETDLTERSVCNSSYKIIFL
ncbi:type VI secretion system baseplate subunit TssF [Phocaeicola coprophilus]|nr:type VI secretion system baseplate subunit TssF [Phocaeicola coprophilus]